MQSIQLVCALFLAFGALVAILIVNPEWGALISSLFSFQIPQVATWVPEGSDILAIPVLLQVAAVYGTMNGTYADFTAYISWWRYKTKEKKFTINSEELTGMKVDLFFSLVIVAVFTIAFMAAGTIILGAEQIVPNGVDLIQAQQSIYTTINSFVGTFLYPLAVLVVIGGSIYAGMDAVPRMIKAWADPLSKRVQQWSFKRFQGLIVLYVLVTSVPLMLIQQPIILASIYLLVTGVIGMWLLGWGALWANQRQLPKAQRFSFPMMVILLLSNIATTVFLIVIFTL
jgi:hypothetical protein